MLSSLSRPMPFHGVAYFWPLCANMTSSITPEVRNVSQATGEPSHGQWNRHAHRLEVDCKCACNASATHICVYIITTFGDHLVPGICWQTDRHADTHRQAHALITILRCLITVRTNNTVHASFKAFSCVLCVFIIINIHSTHENAVTV